MKENIFEAMMKGGGLSRPILHALVFRLSGLVLIFLLQVLLARLMGPAHYGDYTVIITVVNLFIVCSVFGFDSSVLRFLPAYLAGNDFRNANGFFRFSSRFILICSLACSTGLFIFLLSKSVKFGKDFSEGFFWGLLMIPFLAQIYQNSAVLRALGKIKTSLSSVYFLIPLSLGISSACYYYFEKKLTVDATLLIYLCCVFFIFLHIKRKAKNGMNEIATSEKSTFQSRKWISVSSVLFLTTALDLLLRQSDILMVSYFLGNTKAGQYGVAAKLAVLTSLGLSVVDYVFMPKIAALYESRQFGKLQQMIRNSSLQILSITLPVALILLAGGKWILELFGKSFSVSYLPLLILLCGQIINAATGMVGGIMSMTGHQRVFFIYYLAAFTLQFLLNIFLIPTYGLIGAAIGSSVSMIFLNVLGYRFVKNNLRIKASFF